MPTGASRVLLRGGLGPCPIIEVVAELTFDVSLGAQGALIISCAISHIRLDLQVGDPANDGLRAQMCRDRGRCQLDATHGSLNQ